MRTCITILLLLFSAPVGASEAYLDKETGISFPHQVAGFNFIGKREYGSNGLGYGVNYASENGVFATVIVYDLGEKGIVDGVTHPFVRQQFQQAQKEIEQTYRSVRKLNESIKTEYSFLKVGYSHIGPNGETTRAYLFIRGMAGKVVKIRVSYSGREDVTSQISEFITGIYILCDLADSQKRLDELSCRVIELGYTSGKGKKEDYEKLISSCEAAAVRGYVKPQFTMGLVYNAGLGVPQNYKTSTRWFLAAADQGHVLAMEVLAETFLKGLTGDDNPKAAALWYKKAAELGSVNAQYNLGVMYDGGYGVIQDFIMAHVWWNIAGSSGHEDSIMSRIELEKKMTPEQIKDAQALARSWKPKK